MWEKGTKQIDVNDTHHKSIQFSTFTIQSHTAPNPPTTTYMGLMLQTNQTFSNHMSETRCMRFLNSPHRKSAHMVLDAMCNKIQNTPQTPWTPKHQIHQWKSIEMLSAQTHTPNTHELIMIPSWPQTTRARDHICEYIFIDGCVLSMYVCVMCDKMCVIA